MAAIPQQQQNPIASADFIRRLQELGIIDQGMYQRVIIDADHRGIVTVYTQKFGDKRLLQVQLAPDDLLVISVEEAAGRTS